MVSGGVVVSNLCLVSGEEAQLCDRGEEVCPGACHQGAAAPQTGVSGEPLAPLSPLVLSQAECDETDKSDKGRGFP